MSPYADTSGTWTYSPKGAGCQAGTGRLSLTAQTGSNEYPYIMSPKIVQDGCSGTEMETTSGIPASRTYDVEKVVLKPNEGLAMVLLSVLMDNGNYWQLYIATMYETYTPPQPPTPVEVTFIVNTHNIDVGPNGMYVGGGLLGGANATQMFPDNDDANKYRVTLTLASGYMTYYAFFNSPSGAGDWDSKEDLAGLECSHPENYNDRHLSVGETPMTIEFCYETCNAECESNDITFSFSADCADISVSCNDSGEECEVSLEDAAAVECVLRAAPKDTDGDGNGITA